ncbi:MAG: DUF2202 domain-containing protein [Mobilitalea sp.]
MRKEMKKMAAGFMVASLMVAGVATGGIASAANSTTSTIVKTTDTKYSMEEMLVNAISDEYMAQAEYTAIMEKFGVQRPFSNISKAEETHINLLLPLFEEYGVVVPEKDNSTVSVPVSLEAAYQAGADAEVKNIAMYESFLKEDLPADVKVVFERLMSASENHLRAFQNAVDGNCTGTGQQNGKMNRSGRGSGRGNGGNRNNAMGSCLLQ